MLTSAYRAAGFSPAWQYKILCPHPRQGQELPARLAQWDWAQQQMDFQ
jgi:hypothetical protein